MHTFQIKEHTLIADLLQDRELCMIDLGACKGEFADEVARLFPVKQAVLVEPVPNNFMRLQATTGRRLLHRAVASHNGNKVSIAEDPASPYNGSLLFQGFAQARRHWVESINLEEILRLPDLPETLDLLKIDIEGAEYELLLNSREEDLGRFQQITVEFHDFIDESFRETNQTIERRLSGLGFSVIKRGTAYKKGSDYYDTLFYRPQALSLRTNPLLKEKTIFVRGDGGIGNQLFQLAYGLHLQLRFGCRLRGNLGLLAGFAGVPDDVTCAMPESDLPVVHTTDEESVARHLASPFCSAVELRGTFQSYGHFEGVRERLMGLMGPDAKLDAIGIHIRRGDYLRSGHDMNLSALYYRAGVAKLMADYQAEYREIVVFSDDPQWCESELVPALTDLLPVRIFRGGEREALWEMKAMRGMVIPNNPFGWWGAWLANCPTIHPGEWRIPGGSLASALGCTLPYWHSLPDHMLRGTTSLPTIISAFFDLGAFQKGHQGSRDAEHYRRWLRNFARIENPLVFFVDTEEDMQLIRDLRAANRQPTQVVLVDRSLMQAFSRIERVRESIRGATFPTSPPNTTVAEYSCVQHAKYELVACAIAEGMVASSHCCWMDCGVIFDHLGMEQETVYQLGQLPDAGDSIHYTQAGTFSPRSLHEIQTAHHGAGEYCHAGAFFYGSSKAMNKWCEKYLQRALLYQDTGFVFTDQASLYAMLSEGMAEETKAHAFSDRWFGLCRHLLRPVEEGAAS